MLQSSVEPQTGIRREPGSYADYQKLASTSLVTEWVDGELLFMPSPSIIHQLILKLFFSLLDAVVTHFEVGLVLFAPFEVRLSSEGSARQPDICFISADQMEKLTEQRFLGAPALVVEIISPGSVREDQVQKFREYEDAGVCEYWLIDSRPDYRSINLFVRNEDGYFEDIEPTEHWLQSTVVPYFRFDVRWIQGNELVKEQKALAEIMLSLSDLSPELKAYYQFLLKN